ncbi:helix-turn-helix domain-containing protein [Patescibacteria group bacterium]|nr:helix-turn-helix domain-containing protein [Patescibacteria group bacterium]MBU1890595.1 helix-turn-helix domain-containing protein [Patescibacteria group bacterium]
MIAFKKKEIAGLKTLGERLKEVRKETGITLKAVAQETGIKETYLEYLELGEYAQLPSELYIKKYLKRYADYLELNPVSVLGLYEKEIALLKNTKSRPKEHDRLPISISRYNFLATPKMLRRGLLTLAILVCFSYFGFIIHNSISPPDLIVYQPVDNYITSDYTIEVVGLVEKESKLKINGQEIFSDNDGNFKEYVNLQEGINIIEVEANKKHGRSTSIYRKVLVQ